MQTENVSALKIHKLTQAQYDRELAAGNIDENALYLTPDETTIDDVTGLQDALDDKVDLESYQTIDGVKFFDSGVYVGSGISCICIKSMLEDSIYRMKIVPYHTVKPVIITNVCTPIDDTDAANKSYVDSEIAGLSDANIGMAGTGTNGEIFNDYVYNTASGSYSHAEGRHTTASGSCSHAEGYGTTASGNFSHAEGDSTTASGNHSHAAGVYTIANDYQYVLGKFNTDTTAPTSQTDTTDSAGLFIVGVGTATNNRSNGFRINPAGKPYALSTMASSGADYAEYFEWMDGNPTDEDRRGRFVTLDGNKIRYATADDDYILGVVSSEPTVVGDIHSEIWRDMYLRDVFGSRIQETVEVEESVDENGRTIPAHVERRWVLNPDYNPEEKYVSREDRPEWDAVGIVGKLVVVDDGACQVNGYCYPDVDGVATKSESKTAYRVIERLDDTHIKIFIK